MARYTCINANEFWHVCLDVEEGLLLEIRKDIRGGKRKARIAEVIPRYFGKYCKRCAHPLPLSWESCKAHNDKLEYVDATLAAGLYYTFKVQEKLGLSNRLTDYIIGAKQRKSYIPILAASMALVVRERVYGIGVNDVDVVTFVPKREEEYKIDVEDGEPYNQAGLLAEQVASRLGLSVVEAIEKMQALSLAGLDVEERYRRSSRVYRLKRGIERVVDGKRILLVDDVRASGATANTIARLLKDAARKGSTSS